MRPLTCFFVPLLRYARHYRARHAQAAAPCRETKIQRHRVHLFPAIALSRFLPSKATEARWRNSERLLNATLENSPSVAVQWHDQDGLVLY